MTNPEGQDAMKDFFRQLFIAVLGRVIGNLIADLIRRALDWPNDFDL